MAVFGTRGFRAVEDAMGILWRVCRYYIRQGRCKKTFMLITLECTAMWREILEVTGVILYDLCSIVSHSALGAFSPVYCLGSPVASSGPAIPSQLWAPAPKLPQGLHPPPLVSPHCSHAVIPMASPRQTHFCGGGWSSWRMTGTGHDWPLHVPISHPLVAAAGWPEGTHDWLHKAHQQVRTQHSVCALIVADIVCAGLTVNELIFFMQLETFLFCS